ncbi:MAG TPA: hypothetical protein VFV66_17600, partial [Nonomuraea sp.]|nr:hypothetical protein [Nonomuraea sp.]
MGRVISKTLGVIFVGALALPATPAAAAEAQGGRCVVGHWETISVRASGTGTMNGQSFMSEAHGGAGTRMEIDNNSIHLDFTNTAPELHNFAGEPDNSHVQ